MSHTNLGMIDDCKENVRITKLNMIDASARQANGEEAARKARTCISLESDVSVQAGPAHMVASCSSRSLSLL